MLFIGSLRERVVLVSLNGDDYFNALTDPGLRLRPYGLLVANSTFAVFRHPLQCEKAKPAATLVLL